MEPISVFRRFSGRPTVVGVLWSHKESYGEIVCQLETHRQGWQVKLIGPTGTIRSRVCQTEDEVLDTSDSWRENRSSSK